MVEVIEYIFNL